MVRMIKQPLCLSISLAWYLLTDCLYNSYVCPPLLVVVVLSWGQEEEAIARKHMAYRTVYAVLLTSELWILFVFTLTLCDLEES